MAVLSYEAALAYQERAQAMGEPLEELLGMEEAAIIRATLGQPRAVPYAAGIPTAPTPTGIGGLVPTALGAVGGLVPTALGAVGVTGGAAAIIGAGLGYLLGEWDPVTGGDGVAPEMLPDWMQRLIAYLPGIQVGDVERYLNVDRVLRHTNFSWGDMYVCLDHRGNIVMGSHNDRTGKWKKWRPAHNAVIGKNMPKHKTLRRLRRYLSKQSLDAKTILKITSPQSLRAPHRRYYRRRRN